MNKMAIFVEGYTELVFVDKLIEEIAGKNKVLIEHRKIRGGRTKRRSFALIRAAQPDSGQRFFVLIVDCGSDKQVKTRIMEEHESLTRSGYSKIIGVRDVRPDFSHADIPKLEASLPLLIKKKLVPVEFILAILEIEAWFLAEINHYPKIDPAITLPAIITACGFNPETEDMEQRLLPADDLDKCYAIGGKSYVKGNAKDTVEALDYAFIFLELLHRFKYLERLIGSIDAFLS